MENPAYIIVLNWIRRKKANFRSCEKQTGRSDCVYIHSLVSAFDNHYLKSIIGKQATSLFSRIWHFSVTKLEDQNESEYSQEMPQSHNADQPTVP